MKKIIENIKLQVPKAQSGYTFRKSQDLFIPYLEIGVVCLIRDITPINLFFESILELIEIEVKDILELSQILGVSFEVIKEAIVDMIEFDYVGVSDNILRITDKGKEALKTKQLVEIKKENLNKVMINLITGEIYDGASIKCQKVNKHDVCLDKEIDITKAFLDSNFGFINSVFQQQAENSSIYDKLRINKELYKIINISYENLVYFKNELFIYENVNSDGIQLQIKGDCNEQYTNCLYRQLKDGTHQCLWYFFENSFDFIKNNHSESYNFDKKLIEAKNKLCTKLHTIDNIDTSVSELFRNSRYMVTDKEYISYFSYSDEMIFDKLIIITNRVNSMLTPSIFNDIKRVAVKKPVILIYNDKEFNATKTINYYLFSEKGNNNIITFGDDSITYTKILFAPFLEIIIEENIIYAFGRPISYKSGIIKFDNDCKEDLKYVIKMYNIDELIHNRILGNQHNKNKSDDVIACR